MKNSSTYPSPWLKSVKHDVADSVGSVDRDFSAGWACRERSAGPGEGDYYRCEKACGKPTAALLVFLSKVFSDRGSLLSQQHHVDCPHGLLGLFRQVMDSFVSKRRGLTLSEPCELHASGVYLLGQQSCVLRRWGAAVEDAAG
jgi:hypothetical protein